MRIRRLTGAFAIAYARNHLGKRADIPARIAFDLVVYDYRTPVQEGCPRGFAVYQQVRRSLSGLTMSVFTNSASSALGQATQYVSAVLALLGDKEPQNVLRQTAEALSRTLQELTHEQAKQAEADGKWSVRDVLQHLSDSELVWGYRMRMVLSHDRPALVGYDQDLWAHRLHYDEADPEQALETFGVLRRANLTLLVRASPEDFQRVGVHAERGGQTLEQMVRLCAGHDLLHLRQVERIRGVIITTHS